MPQAGVGRKVLVRPWLQRRTAKAFANVACTGHNRIMSATHEATIRARIPLPLKEDTDAVFKLLGISSSEAIRMFLTQVSLRRGLPFPVAVPAPEDNSDILLPAHMQQEVLDMSYDD